MLKGRAHFGYVSVSGGTKLKYISEKYVSKPWAFIHLALHTVNWRFHYKNYNRILVLQKQENT
jgi:hypothetical protein